MPFGAFSPRLALPSQSPIDLISSVPCVPLFPKVLEPRCPLTREWEPHRQKKLAPPILGVLIPAQGMPSKQKVWGLIFLSKTPRRLSLWGKFSPKKPRGHPRVISQPRKMGLPPPPPFGPMGGGGGKNPGAPGKKRKPQIGGQQIFGGFFSPPRRKKNFFKNPGFFSPPYLKAECWFLKTRGPPGGGAPVFFLGKTKRGFSTPPRGFFIPRGLWGGSFF